MADPISYTWREPIADHEMVDLVLSHGGNPSEGWWDRISAHSLGSRSADDGRRSAPSCTGQAVHRSAGPWTPTVHRLLEHLHLRGITWLPRPLGLDEQGREVLSYLPGTVPNYPMPSWVWSEEVLVVSGPRPTRRGGITCAV